MTQVPWDDTYSVGVKIIDQQHKQFLTTFNQLYDAIINNKTEQEMGSILDNLLNYCTVHFQTEEKFFAQTNYPDQEIHTQTHDAFRLKVKNTIDDFKNHRTIITMELLEMLENWLVDHVLNMDKKYEQWLHDHGVK